MLAADMVFFAALAAVIVINLVYGPRIAGDRVAMQWGTDGRPTWTAPKQVALWWMVAFMVAVRTLIWAASIYTPEFVHGAEIGIALFSLIAAASHGLVIMKATRA